MKQKLTKKQLIWLILGIMILVLSGIGWRTGFLGSFFLNKTLTEAQIGMEITKILEKQAKNNGGTVTTNDQGKSWWLSDDGYKITLEPVKTYQWQIANCEQIPTEQMTAFVENTATEFAPTIETFLLKHQFTKVNFTAAYNREDGLYKQYIQAYENKDGTLILLSNDYRCLAGTDGKKVNSYQISVFNKSLLAEKLTALAPILNDLKITSSTGVALVASNNDFVHLTLDNGFIVVQLIAKKMDQVWQGIYSGDSAIDCNLVKTEQIPVEIYQQCRNEKGELQISAS